LSRQTEASGKFVLAQIEQVSPEAQSLSDVLVDMVRLF
jgi:hypothetical protein